MQWQNVILRQNVMIVSAHFFLILAEKIKFPLVSKVVDVLIKII